MITYWKPAWCCLAFERFHVYDHRGEATPRLTIDVNHIDKVDVVRDMDEGDMFSVHVAGGHTHFFRVADVGHPIRNTRFSQWVRRLRRAATRIPTNEYVASESSHAEYMGEAVDDPVTPPARRKRHDVFAGRPWAQAQAGSTLDALGAGIARAPPRAQAQAGSTPG